MARKIVRTVDRTDGQQELPFYNVWERVVRMANYGVFDRPNALQRMIDEMHISRPITYGDITRSDESNGWVNPLGPIESRATQQQITRTMVGGRRNGRSRLNSAVEAFVTANANSPFTSVSDVRRYIIHHPYRLGVITSGS